MRFMAPPSLAPTVLLAAVLCGGPSGCSKAGTPPVLTPEPSEASAERPVAAPHVYFIMVDRFENGDPTNDGDIDPADPHAFHGGDLQGVRNRVGYLADLGVTHVWLSPVFAMRTEKIGEWGAFHGYWVSDLARVEPRFGTEADLKGLADDLHARGMKLVLDMVWNHTDYDAPLLQNHPDWFHQTGDIANWDDPLERVTGRVHGLPDLAQEKQEVLNYLTEVSLGWIDRVGVDGFRIDAVGHMPLPVLAELNDRLDAHRPGFWTVGEDFSGDPQRLATTLREGHFDAVFDFPVRYALVDVFCKGAPLSTLGAILSLDRLYDDPSQLVTFLDNHDVPRFLTECEGNREATRTALSVLGLLRGTPSLTWGAELMLAGGDEPDNRQDQPWERTVSEAAIRAQIADSARFRSGSEAARIGIVRVLEASDAVLVWEQRTEVERLVVRIERKVGAGSNWSLTTTTEIGPVQEPELSFQELVVVVEGDPTGVRVVGAGPELGHWSPERAVPVGPDRTAIVKLPAGTVATFKLVRVMEDAIVWAPGPNTTTLLKPDTPTTIVSMKAP